ncbi:putative proline-specific permease put4 [Fusarium oxysporum f. sp. albedinis]|nr:putative proline-specific permease put4 [Fusarium oxysporum f. sp. albedinis]
MSATPITFPIQLRLYQDRARVRRKDGAWNLGIPLSEMLTEITAIAVTASWHAAPRYMHRPQKIYTTKNESWPMAKSKYIHRFPY